MLLTLIILQCTKYSAHCLSSTELLTQLNDVHYTVNYSTADINGDSSQTPASVVLGGAVYAKQMPVQC